MNNMLPANRVLDALKLYADQEAQRIAASPVGGQHDSFDIRLKQDFYTSIAASLKGRRNPAEKKSLQYLRHEVRKMDAILHPTRFKRFLFHPVINAIANFFRGRYRTYRDQHTIVKNYENNQVRELNLQALQKQITDAGFRLPVESVLRKMINQDMNNFHFRYSDPLQCKNADFVLNFEKLPNSNYYYFSNYQVTSRPDLKDILENKNNGTITKLFAVHAEHPVFAAEAAKLVNKETICRIINDKERWLQLNLGSDVLEIQDIKFDLLKALRKLPLKQLSENNFQKLYNSLMTGAAKSVEMLINSKLVKCTLKVSPEIGKVLAFDSNNRKVDFSNRPKENMAIAAGLTLVPDVDDLSLDTKKQQRL